jgi:23S rRNA (adenine2503-C2)-methyltransferase
MNLSNFYDLSYSDLSDFISSNFSFEKKKTSMRTNQIWKFVYKKGLRETSKFSNISSELKDNMEKSFNFNRTNIAEKKISKDGTIKWLLKLSDNNLVETVFIPSGKRGTLCVSSQVGCTLNCKFCHTGTQLMVKNLTTHEIINQILVAKDELNDWGSQKKITNIVYMGMGEPFYNYDNVKKSISILRERNGLDYSPKKITVSTAGISNEIMKAADEIGTYLALSLHAPTDELREKIMPINKKFKIKDLIESCSYYSKINKEKIFLEYVLLKDINDTDSCAQQLVKLMSKFPSKLNLIEFNAWPGVGYEPSDSKTVQKFYEKIKKSGHIVTLRKSRGEDILGACGQLKTDSEKKRKSL